MTRSMVRSILVLGLFVLLTDMIGSAVVNTAHSGVVNTAHSGVVPLRVLAYSGAGLDDNKVRAIMQTMDSVARKIDYSGDIECRVSFKLINGLGTYNDSFDSVDTAYKFNYLMDKEAEVVVVRFIGWCGGSRVYTIYGCADQNRRGFVVVRRNDGATESILWLHEYLHNIGFYGHVNSGYRVRRSGISPNNRVLAEDECTGLIGATQQKVYLLQNKSQGANETENQGNNASYESKIQALAAQAWEVVPYSDIQELGSGAVLILEGMLDNAELANTHANAILMLGILGEPRVVGKLKNYLFSAHDTAEVTQEQNEWRFSTYAAILQVPTALGALISRYANEKNSDINYAEKLLSSGLDPEFWRTTLHWPRNAQDKYKKTTSVNLAIRSALGLGLSGRTTAREKLGTVKTTKDLKYSIRPYIQGEENAKYIMPDSIINDANHINDIVKNRGLDGYFKQ